jgi:hypothetical protein
MSRLSFENPSTRCIAYFSMGKSVKMDVNMNGTTRRPFEVAIDNNKDVSALSFGELHVDRIDGLYYSNEIVIKNVAASLAIPFASASETHDYSYTYGEFCYRSHCTPPPYTVNLDLFFGTGSNTSGVGMVYNKGGISYDFIYTYASFYIYVNGKPLDFDNIPEVCDIHYYFLKNDTYWLCLKAGDKIQLAIDPLHFFNSKRDIDIIGVTADCINECLLDWGKGKTTTAGISLNGTVIPFSVHVN